MCGRNTEVHVDRSGLGLPRCISEIPHAGHCCVTRVTSTVSDACARVLTPVQYASIPQSVFNGNVSLELVRPMSCSYSYSYETYICTPVRETRGFSSKMRAVS